MPSNLPKTYKAAVFKEKGKPLEFEDIELKLPEDGQVSQTSTFHDGDMALTLDQRCSSKS